jgi:hypothetical protein
MAMYDQRAYARGSHFNGSVQVSADGETWQPAEVSDVSSGGLKFRSVTDYPEGATLWFDLVLEGFLSRFEVKTEGRIRRKAVHGSVFRYGIAFRDLSPATKIQIDENIRGDRPITGDGYEAD